MKRSLVYSIILIFISTCAIAGNFVIHDMTTGIMHEAKDISNTPAGNVSSVKVQTAINELDTEKVDKSGSITQITTRNHADLQNITGNGPVHLSTGEKTNYDTAYTHSQNTTEAHNLTISDVAKKSGDLSQFTGTNLTQIGTRSHTSLTDIGTNTHAQIDTHISNNTNPHGLTISNLALKSGDLSQFSGGYAFKNLSDTPKTYTGKGGFYLRLSTDETQFILDTPGIAPDETVKADAGDLTSGYLNDKITGSIALDAVNHKLQLDGDIGAPGNYKFYGTNGSGIKSFYQIDHTTLSNIGTNTHAQIDSHLSNTTSAHGLTITDVALKSGSLSQFTTRSAADLSSGTLADARLSSNVPLINGTNTFSGNCTFNNIISGNINGNAATATNATTHINNTIGAHNITAITNGADKTGSLSQFTTRNASDINVTATSYGKGLSTAETTVQKVADRVNQNGTPQFVTDASKCSLLLDGLADKIRGITPVNYNSAIKWSDNYINDNSSKEVATNLSCTLKQFEGDEGKFGSGIAVEGSRTNYILYSEDISNTAWGNTSCTITANQKSPRGDNNAQLITSSNGLIQQNVITPTGNLFASLWLKGSGTFSIIINNASDVTLINASIILTSNWTRIQIPFTNATTTTKFFLNPSSGVQLYVFGIQLEAGAFPTSYIATGATAVTRPAGKINFDPNILNGKTDFTLSFWFKPNFNYDTSAYINLFYISNGSKIYTINYNGPVKQYSATLGAGSSLFGPIFASDVQFQQWQNLVISKSGTNASFYFNNSKTNITNAETIANIIYFMLGYSSGTNFCNGIISNFAIFNYALTADEISQIYNSGLEGKPVITTNPINHQDVIRETAGTPNGNIMPMFFGETVYDTTNNAWYKSKKIDNSSFVNPAWLQLN